MIVKVCFFTEKVKDLALKRLAKADSLDLIPIYRDKDDDLGKWTEYSAISHSENCTVKSNMILSTAQKSYSLSKHISPSIQR